MRPFRISLQVIAFVLASAAWSMARADPMPVAPKLSCGSLQSLVARRGGVVLRTSPTTYDRYVASGQSCALAETTVPAWIRSADRKDCLVGYTCEPYSSDDWR